MKKDMIELWLLNYMNRKYKSSFEDIKNEYYKGIFLQMNKIILVVNPNEENDAKLEAILSKKATYVELTHSNIYSLEYDITDTYIQKAVVMLAQENLQKFMDRMNKFPNSFKGTIFNDIEKLNRELDAAIILVE